VNNGDYTEAIQEVGCIVCRYLGIGFVPVDEVHHVESIRDGLSEWAKVGLCHEHHMGSGGIHHLSRRGFEMRYKLSQIDLLALQAKFLWKREAA
jgi:hypothetical protein